MKNGPGVSPATRGPDGWLVFVAPLLWLAWAVSGGLLLASCPRGLDGTDEAAWVLCAADPWRSPGWGIFFGFFLHPFWDLGFGHLAGFRAVGVLALLGFTFLFAQALRRAFLALGLEGAHMRFTWVLPALLIAALARYSIGTRTPSYDWVLLVGGLLFASGWFWLEVGQRDRVGFTALGWCALGLVVAGIGKWTSLPGYLALLAGLLIHKFPLVSLGRPVWIFSAAVLVWTGLFVLYATPEGIRSTWAAGWAQVQTGSHDRLVENYAVGLLKGSWQVLRALPYVAVLFGILWLVLAWWQKRKPAWTQVATLTFLAGVGLAFGRGHGLGGTTTFSKGMMVTMVWLSGVAFLLIPLTRRPAGPAQSWKGSYGRLLVLLLALPWIHGLGTATGITDYLAHGVVFFVAAGCVLLAWAVQRGLPAPCVAAALLAISLIHATRAATSTLNTYRLGSVWVEMEPLRSGPEKGMLLDFSQSVEALRVLDEDLGRLGFRKGDPVVGITDLAALVYLLGGVSPGCCWYMGFWLNENTGVRAHLSHIRPETLARTWVLMRDSAKPYEQLEAVWPRDKGVPPPVQVKKEYHWPWGDGAGTLQPLKVYRPAAQTVP